MIIQFLCLAVLVSMNTANIRGNLKYIRRSIGGELRHCVERYNCPPGHEILPCIEDFQEELCNPCYDNPDTPGKDYVQPDYISSIDGNLEDLKCFQPLIQSNREKAVCTGQDQVYSKTVNSAATCIDGQGCKCDLNNCFYGDPCLCHNFRHDSNDELCDPGYHLNNSGSCVPCPPGTEKKERGCGPCFKFPSNITVQPTQKPITAAPEITTPKPTTTTPKHTTTTPKPTTTTITSTTMISSPREQQDDNSSIGIIIGVFVGILFLLIVITIWILYRRRKLEKIKRKCCGNGINQHDQEAADNTEEEMVPLHRLALENQDNLNNKNVIQRNSDTVVKPENNNIERMDSECLSERFNSGGSLSLGRQLSTLTSIERIDSNLSERRPQIQSGERYDSNPQGYSNPLDSSSSNPVLLRTESVPQQVSQEGNGDLCISIDSPTPFHGSLQRLISAPAGFQHYPENGGGACIPPPNFDNIQSSSPIMNTELPNIKEFNRSLSKDSSSSEVMTSTSSPFNSIPEETGKEIQGEVAAETNISTVVPEPPHISDVDDYTNCHLSQFTDTPQASDITNQIDSRLEQYNHTVTGTEEGATCSVQRFPSEHEEETMKKRDLESNMDSGMMSKEADSGLSSKSESV